MGELPHRLVVRGAVPKGAAAAEPVLKVVVRHFQAFFGRERFGLGQREPLRIEELDAFRQDVAEEVAAAADFLLSCLMS